MVKKIVKIIGSILVLGVVSWLVFQLYLYYVPGISISKSVANSDDFYGEIPLIIIKKESVFGISDEKKEQMNLFTDAITDFERRLGKEYKKPVNFGYDIYMQNGQMQVIFQGYARDATGNDIEINEVISFDFRIKEEKR